MMIPGAVTVAFSASYAAADESADYCVASDTFIVGIAVLCYRQWVANADFLVKSFCIIDFA